MVLFLGFLVQKAVYERTLQEVVNHHLCIYRRPPNYNADINIEVYLYLS